MTTEEQKNYEIGFLSKEEQYKEDVAKMLRSRDFLIIQDGRTSKIKLSYPIKKENFAFFSYLYFSGASGNISELDKELKMNSKILRFLIIADPILSKEKEFVAGPEQETLSPRQEYETQPARREVKKTELLSNEALEKKLEEILQ